MLIINVFVRKISLIQIVLWSIVPIIVVEMEFVNLDFANASQDSMEMAVNLKDVQKIVISMEFAHKMENAFVMLISLELIVERDVVQMIAVEMEYAIALKNVCVKQVLEEKIAQPRLVRIIVEEFCKEYAIRVNAFVEMDSQVNHADSELALIHAVITENASKANVNVNQASKELIVLLRFVLIIAVGMEYVVEHPFSNVPVTMDLQDQIAL